MGVFDKLKKGKGADAAAGGGEVAAADSANPFETTTGSASAGDNPFETKGTSSSARVPSDAAAAAGADAAHTTAAPLQTQASRDSAAGRHSTGGASSGVGETLYVAKETTVSAASVAALIIWTIAVTGWTGFQIVQNGLVWGQLASQPFPKPGNPRVPNNGDPGIANMEIKGLWAILAIECVLLIAFLTLGIALMWVPSIGACRQKRRARRTKRSFLPWFLTLALVACAWFKLVDLSSTLNKMNYQGTWCATNDNLDIKYTFQTQAAPKAGCARAPMATGIQRVMVYAMLTIAFHMLMFFWHQPKGTFGKLFGLLPALLVCALLVLKPVTSLMNMYYTQNAFTKQGNFTFAAELIVALIAFITAVYLSLYMGWAVHSLRLIPRFTNTLLGCCGRQYEDVYYEGERDDLREASKSAQAAAMEEGQVAGAAAAAPRPRRKSYSLRAAGKSIVQQYFFMTQLPSVFGFVSPMITFFALRVQNWWIKFDIIVGAVLVFLYMVLCAFHRQVMAPAKIRA